MTILTAKLTDRKEDMTPPEVVSDCAFLVHNDKNEEAESLKPIPQGHAMVVSAPPFVLRQRRQRSVCLTLVSLLVLVALLLGSVCLYKNLLDAREKSFVCGVRYRDQAALTGSQASFMDRLLADGEFQQGVEIEDSYEKILVPTIGDTRRATILHDFNVNYTAIIDKEQGHCFLMPLNRSLVLPPRDFFDLLVKLRNGYYVPDTTIVREDYRVVTPAISDFSDYGNYIGGECQFFDTYQLVRDGEPLMMAKRAACQFAGERYCLGDAGVDKVLCFNIRGCI